MFRVAMTVAIRARIPRSFRRADELFANLATNFSGVKRDAVSPMRERPDVSVEANDL